MIRTHKTKEWFDRLRNDSLFERKYRRAMTEGGRVTAGCRRTAIGDAVNETATTYPSTEERETLRLMFDKLFKMPETEGRNEYAHVAGFMEVIRLVSDVAQADTVTTYTKEPPVKVPDKYMTVWQAAQTAYAVVCTKKLHHFFVHATPADRAAFVTDTIHRDGRVISPGHARGASHIVCAMVGVKQPNSSYSDDFNKLLDHVAAAYGVLTPLPQPSTQETDTMNTDISPITVDNVVMINGRPADEFSDSQLYTMIAKEEAAIESLNKIKNQPKRLQAEIAKRQAGIVALVTYIDTRA